LEMQGLAGINPRPRATAAPGPGTGPATGPP